MAAAVPLALILSACGQPTERDRIAIASVDNAPGFSPREVTVNQENEVRLRVTNSTSAEHGFSIEGYRRELVLRPGETREVEFKATRGGTFKIFCQLHPAHQTATLVVR
ncbi:MAG: cupredoxin domain-containing protein [Acidimicrobiia bacterium]|jgi:nitrosocyanin